MMNSGKDNINYTPLYTNKIGVNRRKDLARESFYNQGYVPKAISIEDIDRAFNDWVEKSLEITYDGQLLSTHFLLSIQRLSEFGKMWKINDTEGGLLLNFKAISRELDIKHGTQQGIGGYNIPQDNQWWPCGYIPVVENGIESVDVMEMKQPMPIDLTYNLSIFSTKLENINLFATMVLDRFKSLEAYLRVQGQYMSMELQNISDETKNDLEGRRFYSQSYKILAKAYIIQEDDFRRRRLQTRTFIRIDTEKKREPCVKIEDTTECEGVDIQIDFAPNSKPQAKFRLDEDLLVRGTRTHNIRSFELTRNNEHFDVYTCPYFHLYKYEKLTFKIKRMDDSVPAWIRFEAQHSSCVNPPFQTQTDSTWEEERQESIRRLDCVFPKFTHGNEGQYTATTRPHLVVPMICPTILGNDSSGKIIITGKRIYVIRLFNTRGSQLSNIRIIDGGSDYNQPLIEVADPTGKGAKIEAELKCGKIVNTILFNPGVNYTSPVITVQDRGGTGSGAVLETIVNNEVNTKCFYYDKTDCLIWKEDKDLYDRMALDGIEKYRVDGDENSDYYELNLSLIGTMFTDCEYIKFIPQCRENDFKWELFEVIIDEDPVSPTYGEEVLKLVYDYRNYYDKMQPGILVLERLSVAKDIVEREPLVSPGDEIDVLPENAYRPDCWKIQLLDEFEEKYPIFPN
jgi:hypothetical protein